MSNPSLAYTSVKKVNSSGISDAQDILAAEEPLEIRLVYQNDGKRTEQSISVTMRTPGNDTELAVGFLFTEGIISSSTEVANVQHIPGTDNNIIAVTLHETVKPNTKKLERNFYTTSSCGVCGKASIDAVKTVCNIALSGKLITYSSSLIYHLPDRLREHQEIFESTGGLHASALFDEQGNFVMTREDVGRHNALDKLIGASLQNNLLPLDMHLLLLSGRASFELVQKAAMAGIRIVAAVGAPSSLAVELARDCDMTLIGFLRNERFNIYSGSERISS